MPRLASRPSYRGPKLCRWPGPTDRLPIPLTSCIIITCLNRLGQCRERLSTAISGEEKGNSSVLMIRLARVGARKQPHYRIVVIEKERARNGRPVEIVGTYNPRTTPASVELKRDRIDYWRSKGAQVSDRVGKILGFQNTTVPAEPIAS